VAAAILCNHLHLWIEWIGRHKQHHLTGCRAYRNAPTVCCSIVGYLQENMTTA
jgi:hypothetical protein